MSRVNVPRLAATLRGAATHVGDEGYDAARRVWNGAIDKHPEVIVSCLGVDDVIEAVGYARTHGLGVSVRSGGHHVAGSSVLDGGVVIDVSALREVEVDADAARDIGHGRPLALPVPADPTALVHQGRLLALYRPAGAGSEPVAVLA